ncbi:hypothetical protein BX616_000396 [Lobosporangium transversale]|nr:hypothetical protein BX616_000396 [Lobosporangium transversale]
MSKRDTTTKVRALEDLEKWVKAQPEDEEAGSDACLEALGPWIKLYIKLTTDVDRRVRLLTNNVHMLIVKRVKKRLAPYLKEVIGAWVGTFFDPTRDVAYVAAEAFKSAFPDNKRESVISFCLQDMIFYVSEILLNKSSETFSDPRFNTKEEMDSRYARVASSSLYTIGYIAETLSAESLEKSAGEIGQLLDETKLWQFFNHPSPQVRRASYSMLRKITSKAPSLIKDRLEVISKVFFPATFSDKDPTTHGDLWDALLIYTKAFPESWTIAVGKKPTMSLFFGFLKAAGYGSTTVTYRSILPLIASWPEESILGKNGTGFPFGKDFFDNFWKGLSSPHIDKEPGSTAQFLEAYIECMVYFIVRFGKSEATVQGQEAVYATYLNLLKTFLGSTDGSETSARLVQDERTVVKKISIHLVRLLTIPSVRERTIAKLWEPITDIMNEVVSDEPSDIYVNRGKRVIALLAEASAAAREKQDEALVELTEKAADQLVQIVAKKCSGTQSVGPSQLLSLLALHFEVVVFTNPESQKALHDFFNVQFADMLMASDDGTSSSDATSESNGSLPHLLGLFAGYLGNSKEPEPASQLWKQVMDKVLKETEIEREQERQRVILVGMLQRISAVSPNFDLHLESINSFVTDVVVGQQYATSSSGKSLVSSALSSKSIISDRLKLDIIDSLSQRINLFLSDILAGHALGKMEEAESILAIMLESLAHVIPLAIELDEEGPLKQIIVAIFDLSSQSEGYLSEAGQKNLEELQRLSKESDSVRTILRECLTDHIQDNIQNLLRFTSPEGLANQARKLVELLDLTELRERFDLLSEFFFDKEHWNSLYKTLTSSGPHPTLTILDPVVEAFYAEKPSRVSAVETPSSEIRYDSFGLSAYGRLALFTFELLKDETLESLFLLYPDKMTWIMEELLKVRQGCLDAFKTPSSNAGIFYSPHLHTDANAVVFRSLLREMSLMVVTWVSLVANESWESQVIEALAHVPQSRPNVDDDDDDSQCSATSFALAAIKEQDGFNERVLADVVQALAQVDNSQVSPEVAKKWCLIFKSETVPLSVSTGLIIALKKRLENTSEFANLLNYWITAPTKPNEVSIQHLDTVRRLTLLVAALRSRDKDESSMSLPQIRVMNLLQSIRRWMSESDALQSFDSQDQLLIHSILLKLLNALAYQVQELPGAHWEMMFSYILSVFTGLGEPTATPFAILVLERACCLAINLIELGTEEEDIQSVWDDHSEGILVAAMRLIGCDKVMSEAASIKMDRPVRQYLEALSQICAHAPDRLVLSHGSVAEQCRLLTEPLTTVQMLAYRQLQTILVEEVQALSIQMEIKSPISQNLASVEEEGSIEDNSSSTVDADDKMTQPKFPVSLWRIISNPPRGFPAMDVNVDADDEINWREEFSLLLDMSNNGGEDEDDEYGIGAGVAAKSEKLTSHAILGYLLAWKLAFVIFENTTYTVKSRLVEQLRSSEVMNDLLPYLFHLLGVHSASSLVNDSTSNHQAVSTTSNEAKPTGTFDLSKWDITEYQITGFDLSSPEIGFPLLAGHLYYTCLANVPSLVRIWWTECKLRQLSIAVESLTEKYFSPLLIAHELASLAKAKQNLAAGGQAAAAAALSGVSDDLNELQIKTSKATSEVTASFQIDEATMEIVIRLPTNFPLRQVEVEGLQRVGVKEARWRAWLLAVAGVIAAQNGSLIDALTLFRRNVGLHFEGVEDCTICYSIVSLQDRSLPNKTCKTCKNRFHASCLYKWFRTSNSSSCPLCRTLW